MVDDAGAILEATFVGDAITLLFLLKKLCVLMMTQRRSPKITKPIK